MVRIEGRNPVIEALKGRRKINKLLIQHGIAGDRIDLILKQAARQGIAVERVSRQTLEKMASSHAHQGVIAMASPLSTVTPMDMVKLAAEKKEQPFLLILDQIQDPHNIGSMIRTAYAAGLHGVIYQQKRAAGITPIVAKTSAGAIEHIMSAEVRNINTTIIELKEAGLWIAGADLGGDRLLFQADLKGPLAIVIGNEGVGLRHLVKKNCDFLVKIPMIGELGSLNASVAAAIVIYEAVRQRGLNMA